MPDKYNKSTKILSVKNINN